jgi:hypothetical protein
MGHNVHLWAHTTTSRDEAFRSLREMPAGSSLSSTYAGHRKKVIPFNPDFPIFQVLDWGDFVRIAIIGPSRAYFLPL